MSQLGKVYLVGAGPGDPGLLTLKGLKCLAEADLILYDGLVNPLLLRHSKADAERTARADHEGRRTLEQSEINQRLVEAALSGKTVVRLKGGDPFIFGRGSEEAKALADAGVPYEVVPGITAATAASEYAGISLTHREHASAVAFVTGHEDPLKPDSALDYEHLAQFPGTLVFYMGLHRLGAITKALIGHEKSPETPVAVISRGSTPLQKTVTGTLADITDKVSAANLRPPSLIIVGDCVGLRNEINWFENLPLAGLTIGLTRPEDQLDEQIEAAHRLGARPLLMPTIQIRPVEDNSELDECIQLLKSEESWSWLIFTSVNGVDAFFERLWDLGYDSRLLVGQKIACIGPATSERLKRFYIQPDLMPNEYRGEALAEALAPHVKRKNVLWLRASRGRDVLPEMLTAAGAVFESVVAYQHVDVEQFDESVIAELTSGCVDWIGLSSPTIARNVTRLLQGLDLKVFPKFAAISPVTQQAAIESGLEIAVVAETYTWDGIFEAIQEYHRTILES